MHITHQTIHFGFCTALISRGISAIVELQVYNVTCCWPYSAKGRFYFNFDYQNILSPLYNVLLHHHLQNVCGPTTDPSKCSSSRKGANVHFENDRPPSKCCNPHKGALSFMLRKTGLVIKSWYNMMQCNLNYAFFITKLCQSPYYNDFMQNYLHFGTNLCPPF
jgi:hypothetical protein